MMRWDDVKVFLAVHRTRSLTRAAKELRITQATASRRLASIEADFGRPLFVRTPEGTHPTDMARHILPIAEAMERIGQRLEFSGQSFGEEPCGTVRLAMTEDMCATVFVPSLPLLRARYPKLSIELITGQDYLDLTRLQADLAIRNIRPTQGDLVVKRLGSMPGQIFGVARYLNVRQGVPLEELDWIDWSPSLEHLPAARWLKTNLPDIEPVIRANSMQVRRSAVRAGLGVALLPQGYEVTFGDLVRVPNPYAPLPEYPSWLVAHATVRHEARVKAVWDLIVAHSPDIGHFKKSASNTARPTESTSDPT